MKKIVYLIFIVSLAACDSSKPILVGKDTYVIHKKRADGPFVTKSSGEVRIRNQASAFCTSQNKKLQIVDIDKAAVLPETVEPSISIKFMCLT